MVKSRYVAARFEPEQQRKLITISNSLGAGGNMSAALRYLVDRAEQTPGPYKPVTQWVESGEAHGT